MKTEHVLKVLLTIWLPWGGNAAETSSDELGQFLKQAWTDQYTALSDTAVDQLHDDFLKVFQDVHFDKQSISQGFQISKLMLPGSPVLIFHEKNEFKQGNGLFMLRPNATRKILWQAPHGAFDRHTDVLTLQLFLESDSLAAAWNTVHRKYIDLAHSPTSVFQSFTLAYARANPAGRVIQIHGFSQSKRRTAGGRHAEIIISNGRLNPPAALIEMASCLGKAFQNQVLVFGDNVWELGGSTNAQLRGLSNLEFSDFIHIEMNLDTRKRLNQSPADRSVFLGCL